MKKIITTLVAGSILLSFAACSKTVDEPKGTSEKHVTSEETSGSTYEETTISESETEPSETVVNIDPVSDAIRLFPVYQYVDMLTFDASIYTFDPGYFEDVDYKMGLMDINGNIIYGDFSYVDYYEENDSFVVVNLGEFGITECGLVSGDGTKSTGLDYNGYYIDYDGTTYLTKYENGNMIISCFDKDLNVVFENKEIKVDQNIASALYGHRGVCVRASFEDTTVIGSMNTNHDIYNYLIDNETGESISNIERVYGDLMVKNVNPGVVIYDSNGNEVEDLMNYRRYVLFPKEGLILYNDYQAVAVDLDGNIVNTMALKDDYYIDSTDNFIVMNNDHETNIYDKQLNLVSKCEDIRLSGGIVIELIPGDATSIIHASFEGGCFINVISGNTLFADPYNCVFGFISKMGLLYISDKDSETYYDKDLNKVDCAFGNGIVSSDIVTGEAYISCYDSETDISTVYYAATGEIYCELNGYLNDYFMVYDGVLCGVLGNSPNYGFGSTELTYSVIVGSDGEIISKYEVENG